MIFATHGHVFHESHLPPLRDGDILLHGHTHVPKCVSHEHYIYMNPGSVSIPQENSHHGYMTLENGLFLYGCRLNNPVPGLEQYIIKKERAVLRKRQLS